MDITSVIIKEVSIAEAFLLWPEAESYLLEAVDEHEEDPKAFLRQIQAKVLSGINSLWVLEKNGAPVAYAITVIYSPDGLIHIAQIYLAKTTDLQLFIDQMDQFIAWASRRNIEFLEVVGRKGWERVLKPHGFNHNYTSLIKRIAQELH